MLNSTPQKTQTLRRAVCVRGFCMQGCQFVFLGRPLLGIFKAHFLLGLTVFPRKSTHQIKLCSSFRTSHHQRRMTPVLWAGKSSKSFSTMVSSFKVQTKIQSQFAIPSMSVTIFFYFAVKGRTFGKLIDLKRASPNTPRNGTSRQ